MYATSRLSRSFFARPTLQVARELLGQRIVRVETDGQRLCGMIIETEAYIGTQDLGCHARVGRTARNDSMWGPPGHVYVYFTYGMHWMLNFVTEPEGSPAAVLIRGLVPVEGLERMQSRRPGRIARELTDGPAKLCQSLGIDRTFDGHDLCAPSSILYVEQDHQVPEESVTTGPRVGLSRVPEPWKSIPWRFKAQAHDLVESHKEGSEQ